MADGIDANFEGHPNRECGDHRTVGPHRAWCYACTEWCYPSDGCVGCRVPALVAEVERLRADNERLAQVAQSDRETARAYADEIVWSHAERDAALARTRAVRDVLGQVFPPIGYAHNTRDRLLTALTGDDE